MPSAHSCMCLAWLTVLALDATAMKARRPLVAMIFTLILLAPVPVSRIILQDHSATQAMAGSLIGLAIGVSWFGLSIPLRASTAAKLGTRVLGIFTHNYDPILPVKEEDVAEQERLLSV